MVSMRFPSWLPMELMASVSSPKSSLRGGSLAEKSPEAYFLVTPLISLRVEFILLVKRNVNSKETQKIRAEYGKSLLRIMLKNRCTSVTGMEVRIIKLLAGTAMAA